MGAASRRDYAGRIRFIAKDPIASMRLARLGVADVERWHARMRRAGVGETAIRGRHGALRAALSQAVRWGWIGTNPAMAARLRQPRHVPRTAMSTDDVQAVIAAAAAIDPAAVLALRLAAAAGLRRAELAALRWDDLDGDRLTVDSSVARHPGEAGASVLVDAPTKTAKRRVVRLDADTVAAVEALREERSAISPYLFSFDENPPPPSRIGWWTRARASAGIDRKWRVHDLRHWSATIAISGGHDVRTVAGRLGHGNPAMTLRVYAHAVEAADEASGGRARPGPRSRRRPVKPLLLRSEDPPADDVVVVRAGVLNRDDAMRAARRAYGETGILALSVFAALDQAVDELCRDDPDLARYRQIRTTTFGRLRRAGFAVLPTFARPHYDIALADLSDDTLDRLEQCFDAPGPNPGVGSVPLS